MSIDVTVPQLGESVTEATLTKWLVKEGDVVQKDQPVAELATDKADSELPSPAAGRVTKLLVKEGDVVPVRATILQMEEGADGPTVPPPPPTEAKPTAAEPTPTTKGDHPVAPGADEASASSQGALGPLASPSSRRAALVQGVDLQNVKGSGEHGRITRDDVNRAGGPGYEGAGQKTPAPAAPAAAPPAAPPASPAPPRSGGDASGLAALVNQGGGFVPPVPGVGFGSFKVPPYRPKPGDQVIPFTRRRRITADHMLYSKFSSPHVVTVAECDLQRASKLREANKDRYKKEGMSLTMLAFLVVAAAKAIRENPTINARVLDDAYVIFKDVNLGVAVDSPDGLVVPVIRRADELGVRGIVRAIDDVAVRARKGKITVDDLSGATFSITNPGLKGNLFGGAIINQPNVGILRMGEIKKRAVVVEGPDKEDHIAIHPVMYMALSYDHRIVDGVAANSFLWRVREILEKAEFEV
ncbi:MAG: Dihydrolipoamide acyltransferase component of branched-chain alpha-keto acid dehydrogenase complex [Labilithrix sp.]|nr:Dihydrolipoamide acyltransferase component of branched-chain alpha-keto acid dehydrogenase complex [Labilithrix sp.]